VTRAILLRVLQFDIPPLRDEDLVGQADELFRELDIREATDEQNEPR
jgi:hypothetical protein